MVLNYGMILLMELNAVVASFPPRLDRNNFPGDDPAKIFQTYKTRKDFSWQLSM